MKKIVTFCALLIIFLVLGYALKLYVSDEKITISANTRETSSQSTIQKKLQTFQPIFEDKHIVAIVLATNCGAMCERNLDSILAQNYEHFRMIYIDNGSEDGTYEKVQKMIAKKKVNEKVELIRFDEKKPDMEILYQVIHSCAPQEIIALVNGKDWLAHENVFDHLNCAYAHPDVWMSYSRAITHPEFQEIAGNIYPDEFFLEKKFRQNTNTHLTPLHTFYAGFFQKIKLEDFLFDGRFIPYKSNLAILFPLLEMGPEHVLFLDEIAYVKNESKGSVDNRIHAKEMVAVENYLRYRPSYPKLTSLHRQTSEDHRYRGDIVIFSEDRPLHLYACLESLYLKVRDINDVCVIYSASDAEFERAYLNLQKEFPSLQFLSVYDYLGNDFQSLLSSVLISKRHGSPYLLVTDDQVVFDEKVHLHDIIVSLEKNRR